MQPPRSGIVSLFAVLNFCFAGLGLLGFLFIGGILVYGIFFSGDTGEELAAGVIGCLFIMAFFFVGTLLYLIAAIGLLRKAAWGYYCHLVGAAFLALTCLGLAYTIPAFICAFRPEFQEDFFRSPWHSPVQENWDH
jgi:hypothetical protein